MKTAIALSILLLQIPQPVFRTRVDFVELDVSVLGRDRLPVTGLTAADFTVLEDSVPQKIETFLPIVAPAVRTAPAVWSNTVPDDVESNVDRGEGSLLTLLIDDEGIGMAGGRRVKAIARSIVDRMSASDRMAIVFTLASGRSQTFTRDRALLYRAIDRFSPGRYVPEGLGAPDAGARAIPRSGGSAPRRSACDGVVGALSTIARVTADYPGRRKMALVISERLPELDPTKQCFDPLLELYRDARRANLNVYPINPRGLTVEGEAEIGSADAALATFGDARTRSSAERMLAENTGGFSLSQTNAFDANIERVFAENRSYYLLGYHSTNKSTDNKLRTLNVKVARDGVAVRARSAYVAGAASPRSPVAGVPADLAAASASLLPSTGLPLEATVIPFRRGDNISLVVVAAARPRLETGGREVTEEIQIRALLLDSNGKLQGSAERRIHARGAPVAGAATDLRVPMSIDAKPGAYQLRVAANSRASGATGSVFLTIDVPDFNREPVSLSGVSIGVSGDSPAMTLAALASLVPFTPSTRRDFRRSQKVEAALRLYASADAERVSLVCRVRDAHGEEVSSMVPVFAADQTRAPEGALVRCAIPVASLAAGRYLFDVEATSGRRSSNRQVKFSVE